jgi:hypothetical protein
LNTLKGLEKLEVLLSKEAKLFQMASRGKKKLNPGSGGSEPSRRQGSSMMSSFTPQRRQPSIPSELQTKVHYHQVPMQLPSDKVQI